MLRKFILAFALLALMAGLANAGSQEFVEIVSATDTNTVVTIDLDQCGDSARTVYIYNDGGSSDEVYYDPSGDGIATTSNAYIPIGGVRQLGDDNGQLRYTLIGLICDSGETATVQVIATCARE